MTARPLWWVAVLIGLDSIVALLVGRSYGNLPSYAATAAVTAPLMPWPVWPLVAWLLWERNAVGALLAFSVGVLVRCGLKPQIRGFKPQIVGVGVLGLLASQAYWKRLFKGTFYARLAVWHLALGDWTVSSLLVGHGVTGWIERIAPAAALRFHETWPLAANEPLEVFYAFGLCGLIPLALLLVHQRTLFVHRTWGGALSALGVMALSFPALHYLPLMVVGGAGVAAAVGTRR